MPGIRCPNCGSTDELVGTDTADGKIIDCRSCGHRWQRDLTPTCRLCGSTDLEAVPTATLHARQVAHLDVRPDKILVAADGARLVDLGSGRSRALLRDRAAGDDRLAFQAPEQVLARENGPSADVYSLGLTLWIIAGGDATRMGINASAQASYRLTHNVPLLDAKSQPSDHLIEAIAAATRRRPDARPAADRLAALLRAGAGS